MSIHFEKKLPVPAEIKRQYPLSPHVKAVKEERDKEIRKVFTGESNRFLVIIGPLFRRQRGFRLRLHQQAGKGAG